MYQGRTRQKSQSQKGILFFAALGTDSSGPSNILNTRCQKTSQRLKLDHKRKFV